MSSDHRRQIDQGSVSRSRDRWRPPDQKRERSSAGDRTADLKTLGNNNSSGAVNSAATPARQFSTNRRARRFRLVGRLCDAPDADTRWAVLLAHLERKFAIGSEDMDRALGGIIEAPPARIMLYAQIGGAQ
jgi:hypothetical protein